jgi:hypothetical protein
MHSKNFDDKTGRIYGKLTVLSLAYTKKFNSKYKKNNTRSFWLCECLCGNQVTVVSYNLSSGTTQSCGCRKKETLKRIKETRLVTHPARSAKLNVFASYKSAAKSRKIEFKLTTLEFHNIVEQSCFYCDLPSSNICKRSGAVYFYNGIDRVDNNLGYIPTNCVPCCKECNKIKNDSTLSVFLSRIEAIIKNKNKIKKLINEYGTSK